MRPLTERGEQQSRAAGAALRALEIRLDCVLTSPRVRALDTARLACAVYGDGLHAEIWEPLSIGFDAVGALALFATRPPDAHVLLVGHEPSLADVIGQLTGAHIKLKKGGIAMVDVSDAHELNPSGAAGHVADGDGRYAGELVLLARPRELAHIAGVALSEV